MKNFFKKIWRELNPTKQDLLDFMKKQNPEFYKKLQRQCNIEELPEEEVGRYMILWF